MGEGGLIVQWDVKMITGCIWLRKAPSGMLLWTQNVTIWFNKNAEFLHLLGDYKFLRTEPYPRN
jgi:hypothetical protein